ncbi:MAG: lectin like domain-containing protein [Clostridiales bacterium]|nr:lectin like domain-containing protein [Clostridiales bacterium]
MSDVPSNNNVDQPIADYGQVVAYTPEYKEYLKDKKEGSLDKYKNYVPFPFIRQVPLIGGTERVFPTSFDPRMTYMTPVKNQNPYGTCWAFASVGNLEALVSKNTGIKNIYSEEHVRFWASNENLPQWFSRDPGDGGNFVDTAASITPWVGPVYQSDAPYNSSPGNQWDNTNMSKPSRLHVTSTKVIGSDINSIKQVVTDYGSVHCALRWHDVFYNVTYYAYNSTSYHPPDEGYHAVLVCGWNDNFARTNFNLSYRPANNGAWLVKNSWGTGFGDLGYFWLSYEDASVYGFETFTGFRPVTGEKMLALDTNIMGMPIEYLNETYMCNMFDLTSQIGTYPVITDIMIQTGSIGSSYSINIVPAPSGSLPPIGSLPAPVATGTHTYTGACTVTLPTPYLIPGPGKYAFIVKTSVGNNSRSTCYMEYIHREYNGLGQYYKNRGESFIYAGSGWVDNYDIYIPSGALGGNWCIRPILQAAVVTTFTPVVKGSITAGTISLGLIRGQCVSMGHLKFILIHVVINSISGSPSGNLQITGSPYLPIYEMPLDLGITSYTGVNLNDRYLTPQILPNGVIEILSCGDGSEQALPVSILASYATLQVAGCFISNS